MDDERAADLAHEAGYDLDEDVPADVADAVRMWREIHTKGWPATNTPALIPLLGWNDFGVAFVRDLPGHHLFKQVHRYGTLALPLMVLDARKMGRFAKSHDVPIRTLANKVLLDGYARAFVAKYLDLSHIPPDEVDRAADIFIDAHDDGPEEAVEALNRQLGFLKVAGGPKAWRPKRPRKT